MARKQKKKAAPQRRTAGDVRGGRFWRYCSVLVLTGVLAMVWLCLLSFSPNDPPAGNVYEVGRVVENKAGWVGAQVAYWLRYWLGGGVYMGLAALSVASAILLFGGRVRDWPWRIIGVALLITATSAAVYLLNGDKAGGLNSGTAGVLGTGVGRFLFARFAAVGAWLILVTTLCVALMLTADNLVIQLPRLGKKLWEKRSELPSVTGLFAPRTSGADNVSVTAAPRAAAAAPTTVGKSAKRPGPPKADETESPRRRLGFLSPGGRAAKNPAAPAAAKPAPAPRQIAKPTNGASGKTGGGAFFLPPTDLLAQPTHGYNKSQETQAAQKQVVLQQTLNDFNVAAEVVGYSTGPVITMFEMSLAPGVKVAQVANLANDIARALAVPGVRVVSPLPGKDTIGIEVPNMDKEIVRIKELMDLAAETGADKDMALPLYLGKDANGMPIVADLAAMPHMLMAGTTGSGKSVCINAIITSMLMTRTPEYVRFILVDPKMVEMAAFEQLPHLLCPIVNDMRKAEEIIEWAATKMDERYELLKEANVKNIAGYNRLGAEELYKRFNVQSDEEKAAVPAFLQYYVIIIDELADLIMTSSKEVEGHIIRIAQKARAVGIHLILATQRPSVNVVTGLIKSNMPCRISFRVASRQESRIVLDQNGADVLMGQGDMLFLQPGSSTLRRAQGAYVDESEIRGIVGALRDTGQAAYNAELMRLNSRPTGDGSGERDELFDKGVEIVLASQRGSVSLLQRRLQIGYSRASRIIDQMADAGILGDYKGSQARECHMTLDDWQTLKKSIAADQSGASAANGEPTIA